MFVRALRKRLKIASRCSSLLGLALVASSAGALTVLPAQNFGQAQVGGSTELNITVSIPGLSADPVFSINYARVGDFTVGSSVCQQPTSCTVPVTFSPQLPGFRKAALIVKDTTGTVIATALLSGIGLGPDVAIYPGIITTVPGTNTALWDPEGVAVDPAGNVFVSDTVHEAIKLISGGLITPVSTAGVTFGAPTGLALDGAGNIYVADAGNNVVVQISPFTGRAAVVAGGGHPAGRFR